MPLHWILYSPYSEAMFFVSIFKPPFAAAYADTVSLPSSDIMEQILMIFPAFFFIMPGMTAFAMMKGAFRSTSTTLRNASTSISCIGILLIIPALFTRISMTPIFSSMSATIFFTASSSVTSQTYPWASIPFSLYAANPRAKDASLLQLNTTVAPASA